MGGLSTGINNLWRRSGQLYSGAARIGCCIDFVWSYLRYGATPSEYFMYEFYRKSGREKKTFLTRRDYKTTYEKINTGDKSVLSDKMLFNRRMADYIGREWLDGCSCTAEDFAAFARKHPSMIIKPHDAMQGKGVWRLDVDGSEDLAALFEEKVKGSLVEERLIQHSAMEQLAPNSVNCLRVLTLNWGDGRVDIVACSLKTGGGKLPVDNLHLGGGVGAGIDLETGLICTPAKPWEGEPVLYHPVSGEKMIGFRIPNWEIFNEKIREAARMIPEVPLIGWDCAVTEEGIALIEGNEEAGPVLIQYFDLVGKRPILRDYIKQKK